jgi:hypothetical protein
MRSQEFINEDVMTPAQQAAQRAGLGRSGALAGPAGQSMAKTVGKAALKYAPMVGTAMSAAEAYDRWQAGDRTGAVISVLAAAGYLVPGPAGWVLGGSLDLANMSRDAGLVQDPFGPLPDNYTTTQKKMKQPWDHS